MTPVKLTSPDTPRRVHSWIQQLAPIILVATFASMGLYLLLDDFARKRPGHSAPSKINPEEHSSIEPLGLGKSINTLYMLRTGSELALMAARIEKLADGRVQIALPADPASLELVRQGGYQARLNDGELLLTLEAER